MSRLHEKCSFCGTSTPVRSLDIRLIQGKKYQACRKCKGIYDGNKPDGYYQEVFEGVKLDLSAIDRSKLPVYRPEE